MFKSHPDSSRVRQDQPDLVVDDFFLLFGSTFQTFAAIPYFLTRLELGEIFAFAKPFFDPRESCCLFRVYIFCVRIWRSTVWSSRGVSPFFVVVDAAF